MNLWPAWLAALVHAIPGSTQTLLGRSTMLKTDFDFLSSSVAIPFHAMATASGVVALMILLRPLSRELTSL